MPLSTADFAEDATHDAWIVGTHELPPEFQGIDAKDGDVVVVDRERGVFDVMTEAEFNDEYEWIVEVW